jgi:oxygen-dependent protoporphyrinogen oxidase
VIVGGGVTGLAAALRATERAASAGAALDVQLFEAESRTGGVISSEARDGFLLELGPDSLVTEKPWAIDLCRHVGLGSELIPTNAAFQRSLVVSRGRLVPLPLGFSLLAPTRIWPFVRSPVLSLPGKLRMLWDLFAPRGGPRDGEDESLASFVLRRFGREALERLAQPMVAGIYTADPTTLSLAATMPRFLEIERRERSVILGLRRQVKTATAGVGQAMQHASGARYGLFMTLRHGLGSLVAELESRLPEDSIRRRARVARLELGREPGAASSNGVGRRPWRVVLDDGRAVDADAVLVALPAHEAARLLAPLDAPLGSLLAGIPYASAATVSLGFRRSDLREPLAAFGFVVPAVERRRIVACTFVDVKYSGRAPEDCVLLRGFIGGALQAEMFELDDAAMVATLRAELRSLLGVTAPPLLARVARWPRSMPQYLVGHVDRVAEIERRTARIAGLALAGNAYRGVGIADCVRSGEAAADTLVDVSMRPGLSAPAAGSRPIVECDALPPGGSAT